MVLAMKSGAILPGSRSSGLILAASAIEDLRRGLAAAGWHDFTVAQFKDRFGLSRKWAIPLLEQALTLDPDLAKAHVFLGQALMTLGEYERAMTHLETARTQ